MKGRTLYYATVGILNFASGLYLLGLAAFLSRTLKSPYLITKFFDYLVPYEVPFLIAIGAFNLYQMITHFNKMWEHTGLLTPQKPQTTQH